MLPKSICDQLKQNQEVTPKYYQSISILFCEVMNFSQIASILPPGQLVDLLNTIYSAFDHHRYQDNAGNRGQGGQIEKLDPRNIMK